MSKACYERLARTPKVTANKVSKFLELGYSLKDIQSRFGPPTRAPYSEPFVTPGCADYPERLLELYDPPLTLFHRGLSPGRHAEVVVGIVGSRKATSFGLSWARRLATALSQCGASVCSGLALGIDAAAHRAVVDELKRDPNIAPPIGVLGHGWGQFYPARNRALAAEIEAHGTLLTEYPPGYPPSKATFPARNRLIAALSDHLVVVEAGAKSGSLHTARFALELHRPVWIVPNAPERPNSAGILGLWRDGANIIVDLEEFVTQITWRLRLTPAKAPSLDDKSWHLFHRLADLEGDIDQICSELEWSATELAYRLTELELEGLITRAADGNWTVSRWDLAEVRDPAV